MADLKVTIQLIIKDSDEMVNFTCDKSIGVLKLNELIETEFMLSGVWLVPREGVYLLDLEPNDIINVYDDTYKGEPKTIPWSMMFSKHCSGILKEGVDEETGIYSFACWCCACYNKRLKQ